MGVEIGKIRRSRNPKIKILGIVLTMVKQRTAIQKKLVEWIEEHEDYGKYLLDTMIHENVTLQEVTHVGKEIVDYNDQKRKKALVKKEIAFKGYENYLKLADEILNRISNKKQEENSAFDEIFIEGNKAEKLTEEEIKRPPLKKEGCTNINARDIPLETIEILKNIAYTEKMKVDPYTKLNDIYVKALVKFAEEYKEEIMERPQKIKDQEQRRSKRYDGKKKRRSL